MIIKKVVCYEFDGIILRDITVQDNNEIHKVMKRQRSREHGL